MDNVTYYLVNEVLHTALQTPPAKMYSHQLICSHIVTVTVMKLFLQKNNVKQKSVSIILEKLYVLT